MPKNALQRASRLNSGLRGMSLARFPATLPCLRTADNRIVKMRRHTSFEFTTSVPPRVNIDDNGADSSTRKDVLTHPEYSEPTADLVVVSSDGMRFHVHSAVLKLASETLARALRDSQGRPVEEDRTTLRELFDSVYPRRLAPKLEPFTLVANLAIAAEKYNVQRVSKKIREALLAYPLLHSGTPLHQYALATNLLWDDAARHVSRYVSPPNPTNAQHRPILQALCSGALVKLMSLYHVRREILVKALSISYDRNSLDEVRMQHIRWEMICKGHPDPCHSCDHNMAQWDAFKLSVLMKLERESPDDFVRKVDKLWECHQFKIVVTELCSRCSKPFFDKDAFMVEFLRVINCLPSYID